MSGAHTSRFVCCVSRLVRHGVDGADVEEHGPDELHRALTSRIRSGASARNRRRVAGSLTPAGLAEPARGEEHRADDERHARPCRGPCSARRAGTSRARKERADHEQHGDAPAQLARPPAAARASSARVPGVPVGRSGVAEPGGRRAAARRELLAGGRRPCRSSSSSESARSMLNPSRTTMRSTATSVASSGIVYAGTCQPPVRSWSETWNTVNAGVVGHREGEHRDRRSVADHLERPHLGDLARQVHGDVAQRLHDARCSPRGRGARSCSTGRRSGCPVARSSA